MWWEKQIAKCQYRLGSWQDAERLFKVLFNQSLSIDTGLWLAKIYVNMDQPLAARKVLLQCLEINPYSKGALISLSRLHEVMHEWEASMNVLSRVIRLDPKNLEALSSLAADYFYSGQPEVAYVYYQRIVQMGQDTVQIWNNLALSAFYAHKYENIYEAFNRAERMATCPSERADVWFNLSCVAVASGNLDWAVMCCNIALFLDATHSEALNNLAVRRRQLYSFSHPGRCCIAP